MFKPLEINIGLRYTRAKRRNHFISFISLISMLGIALGVMALITVLSVMNGFEKELRERILGVVAHGTIQKADGVMTDWKSVYNRLEQTPEIVGAAPYIFAEGMLSKGASVNGSIVRGVLPEYETNVSNIGANMLVGSLDDLIPGRFGVVLGKELAFALGVNVGDKVTLITPQTSVTPVGVLPRLKRVTVVGVFEIGMYEYDSALALLHLEDAARLFNIPNQVTGVRIKLGNMFEAPLLTKKLSLSLSGDYQVSDWTRQHVNFFKAVRTEKTVMFVILLLIVAVAAFNLVSTLVMMVTDKESDIAILRTLGSSPASIMGIFIVQGAVIGVIGTLLGTFGGIALALNVETIVPAIERLFDTKFLAADVYYITELPSDHRWSDTIKVSVVAMLLSLVATIYPAWRASRTNPAEALRYE
ncbi:MAG: lipoprotein-releasing ABC transporter permease subunit [Gammaproteobacteria bacterium]